MKNFRKISFHHPKNFMAKTLAVLLVCVAFQYQQVLGQLTDDFSDGDFTSAPSWSGSASHFIINTSQQLQLSNTVAGTSVLTFPFSSSSLGETEWQFYIRLNFSGSAGNFSRVYLVSDQQDLTTSLNGYYLQFGEAGSNDAVELFRQAGTTSTSVCRATNGSISAAFSIRVKVTRNNAGFWKIFIDYSGGTSFVEEATGIDNTPTTSSFFGIRCTYTLTNANRFFYDDVSIVEIPAPDITSPQVNALTVASSTEISVEFSEVVDKPAAETLANYAAGSSTHPVSAILQADQKVVALLFPQPFANGVTQNLTVRDVKDISGNAMTETSLEFLFFHPVDAFPKDIVITELFADPTPSSGLPESEFVEIFNRSQNPFNLEGWKLTDGSSTATLSKLILLPGDFLILTSSSSQAAYSALGKTMGVSSFPSLNNSGDAILLKDPSGKTIDSVSYTLNWYRDDEKKDGGWSIEMIDPENRCAESENWIASENSAGGTPGKQNSVFANKPDNTGPKLMAVIALSKTVLQLKFDEKLEKALPSSQSFAINPLSEVASVAFEDGSLTSLTLLLHQELQGGILYTITAKNIYDCPGNIIQPEFNSVVFALPEKAESLDVIVNELLFNPTSTGVDFVEVYNRSGKYINLKGWKIINGPGDDETISDNNLLLEPGSYKVFTENPNTLKGEYLQGKEETFFTMGLPSFADEEGSISITDSESNIIDAFVYSDEMHSQFIKDPEGVSLERISFEQPTHQFQNWKSASSDAGYATPGFINSNARTDGFTSESILVEPEIFTPSIGQQDFAQVKYFFEKGGYVANVKILDARGREIKRLANNELLGTEGFFRWDGDENNGGKARIGSYMVWFEIFDSGGTVKTFRKRVVVADKF
jgi:hypothetical protein